jgi:hypothetical protein
MIQAGPGQVQATQVHADQLGMIFKNLRIFFDCK